MFPLFPSRLSARDPAGGTWKKQHAPGWQSGRWPSRCGSYCCTELRPGCRRRPPPSCPSRSLCSPLQAGSTRKHMRKWCFGRFLRWLWGLTHKRNLQLQHRETTKKKKQGHNTTTNHNNSESRNMSERWWDMPHYATRWRFRLTHGLHVWYERIVMHPIPVYTEPVEFEYFSTPWYRYWVFNKVFIH